MKRSRELTDYFTYDGLSRQYDLSVVDVETICNDILQYTDLRRVDKESLMTLFERHLQKFKEIHLRKLNEKQESVGNIVGSLQP